MLGRPSGSGVEAARRAAAGCVTCLPDGERGKTLAELERAAKRLSAGATRRSLVIALGGGAVTDAAGFLAATFMRGVEWAAVPTTLLSMVDAALGGKTAVNLPVAKNAVGSFHPPIAVLADPVSLETLPARELRSGFGEVVKYGRSGRSSYRGSTPARAGRRPSVIAACARAKLEIVEHDPMERGERKLLNLGHTFGHGVEAAGGSAADARRGGRGGARLRVQAGPDPRPGGASVGAMEDVLLAAGLPVRVPKDLAKRAARLMGYDKKRTERGLQWVLPLRRAGGWAVSGTSRPSPGRSMRP